LRRGVAARRARRRDHRRRRCHRSVSHHVLDGTPRGEDGGEGDDLGGVLRVDDRRAAGHRHDVVVEERTQREVLVAGARPDHRAAPGGVRRARGPRPVLVGVRRDAAGLPRRREARRDRLGGPH
ncbi:hypothetical protein IAE22_32350, partial [Bacillus sp. S34]|nr:hypothetical protein [Bacillus sp. S34]